jgi:hypothetical protein
MSEANLPPTAVRFSKVVKVEMTDRQTAFVCTYGCVNLVIHHRSAVQTVAGVSCPGIATQAVSQPPDTHLDGRSLECINLSVWLSVR